MWLEFGARNMTDFELILYSVNKLIKQKTWKLDVVTWWYVLHLIEAGSGFRDQQLQMPKHFHWQ